MANILVLQVDNRDLDYLGLTKKLSKFMCKTMTENEDEFKGFTYNYLYMDMNNYTKKKMNPCTTKIHVMNDILHTARLVSTTTITTTTITTTTTTSSKMTTTIKTPYNESNTTDEIPAATVEYKTQMVGYPETKTVVTNNFYDAIVFLDSDAWIQSFQNLHRLVIKLLNSENKHGCYSRDPYIKQNTYINSGSFIIKVDDYVKNMYRVVLEQLEHDESHWDKHPYDQFYLSNFIYEHKDDFMVFKPPIVNTPLGAVIRHNWWKTHKMFFDLYELLDHFHKNQIPKNYQEIDFDKELDDLEFPNPNEEGYVYRH